MNIVDECRKAHALYKAAGVDGSEGARMMKVAADEIERLRDGIDAIRQYGSDTLSGPSNRNDDTRDWQRGAVLEMTNRSVRILDGRPWLSENGPHSEEQADG